MYEDGMSIRQVADHYGITRQGMWDILDRRGVKFRPQLKYGEDNHFYVGERRHLKKASHLVEKAVNKGDMIPQPCEVCGER
jgi:predicted DNA-binding protein YlxM (UPF0122 family)